MIVLIMTVVGFIRGIHEGMIHIRFNEKMHNLQFQEGVRGHKWHDYYHLIAMVRDISILGLGIALVTMNYHYGAFIAGLLLLWEFSEVGQACARVAKPVMFDLGLPYEYIVVFDRWSWIVRGNPVYVLHAFRIVFVVGLLFA